MAQVEVDVILAADAAALVDLGLLGAGNDVARRQLHLGRRVGLHEALALVVDDIGALAAGGLGKEDAVLVEPGGVELDELHVLQRQARLEHQGHAVAGVGVGVGSDLPGAAVAAGGQQHGAGVENVQAALADVPGHQAAGHVVADQQRQDLELVEEEDIVLQALLVQGVQQHVAGDVLGEAGARRGMAAEGALVDAPVLGARKGDAHVLELVDGLERLVDEALDDVLVGQVVAALDGVEHVRFQRILAHVGQGGGDAPLGPARMRAGRVDLADHGRRQAALGHFQGGAQAGQAGADDHGVDLMVISCFFDLHGVTPLGDLQGVELDDGQGADEQQHRSRPSAAGCTRPGARTCSSCNPPGPTRPRSGRGTAP